MAAGLVLAGAGCSHESWTTLEETTRFPAMAAPVIAPVNLLAVVGRVVTAEDSGSTSDHDRRFVLSREVMAEFSSDATIMTAVMACQERFLKGDFGEPVPAEPATFAPGGKKGGRYGRYALGPGKPVLVISSEGTDYAVRYEHEVVE